MTKEQIYRKALFDIMKSLPLCDHMGDVFDYVADDLPAFDNETEEEQEISKAFYYYLENGESMPEDYDGEDY